MSLARLKVADELLEQFTLPKGFTEVSRKAIEWGNFELTIEGPFVDIPANALVTAIMHVKASPDGKIKSFSLQWSYGSELKGEPYELEAPWLS